MKVFIFAAVVAVSAVMCKPSTSLYKPDVYQPKIYKEQPKYKEEPRPYAFDYTVSDYYSGANFAQSEKSDGSNTEGYYTAALPDGRIQTVSYVADHYNGYSADVSYKGEAQFPKYTSIPSYIAPSSCRSAPRFEPNKTYKPIKSYGQPSYH